MVLITYTVSRLKRVDVQVNEGKNENTFNIFQKIKTFKSYNFIFYSILGASQVILLTILIYFVSKTEVPAPININYGALSSDLVCDLDSPI